MPTYMFHVHYTPMGVEEIIDQGGSQRMQSAVEVMDHVGGSLESWYYAMGDTDAYAIAELPDDESAAAASLGVNARGAVSVRITKLLSAEQIDAAIEKVWR